MEGRVPFSLLKGVPNWFRPLLPTIFSLSTFERLDFVAPIKDALLGDFLDFCCELFWFNLVKASKLSWIDNILLHSGLKANNTDLLSAFTASRGVFFAIIIFFYNGLD
jgi:hypothetical protein